MKSILLIVLLFVANTTFAQSEEDLAKAAQNPVANMYSLPFQYNTIYGVGHMSGHKMYSISNL